MSSLLLGLVLLGLPALAEDVGKVPGGQAPEAVAAERDDDGIWAWIERLDGEILSDEAMAAIAQDAEERAYFDDLYPLDVPEDYYRDPRRVLTGDPLLLDQLSADEFGLPLVLNGHVEQWLKILTGPGRGYFKRWLERKARYEDMVYRELDAAGLPRDLIYLAMVESGFNTYAYSPAAAGGMWQFIPSTAKLYGLEVDFWLDERRDPEKATKAALTMLGELNDRFGDWYLAFAAYNTGPARVARAIVRADGGGRPVDYWTLVDQDLLHRETKGYVPKIIAAMILGHHPERYGFTDLELHEPLVYDAVHIDDAVDVDVLARCAGITSEEFQALNPALRRFAVPEGGIDLRVPLGMAEPFLTALAEVPEAEKRALVMHSVARGESLSVIASRYGVSMADVQTANRIRDPHLLSVGQKLIIPVSGRQDVEAVVQVQRAPSNTSSAPQAAKPVPAGSASRAPRPERVTVRPGDTLSELSERYDVPMTELLRLNGLARADDLKAGVELRLVAPSAPVDSKAPAAAAPDAPAKTYKVQSGDSLSVIAERFGVSMAELVRINGLADASSIRVGQVLELTGDAKAPSTGSVERYTVRKGDTLSEIAGRFGVSQADLVTWNRLSKASSLKVGQVLEIRPPADGWTQHTVKAGESLGIIASRYGVKVSDLQSWNNLRDSTIYPGDALRIRKP